MSKPLRGSGEWDGGRKSPKRSCSQSISPTQLRLFEDHHRACNQTGRNLRWKNLQGVWRENRSLTTEKNQGCQGKSRHLRSGDHPELKYWLHKIELTLDTIYRKCGLGEETAEHVVHDCPRIHHPPNEPTPADTLAKDSENMGEVDLCPRFTWCLTARNHHHLIYPSRSSPLPTPPFHLIRHNAQLSALPSPYLPTQFSRTCPACLLNNNMWHKKQQQHKLQQQNVT